jgi:hypothetical protein
MSNVRETPRRIVSLQVENIKRVVSVFIQPNGRMIELTGKNKAGKTSTLDALWWAFTGGRDIQTNPIRAGAEKAVIKADLGDIIVTRTFKSKPDKDPPYTTSLVVETAEGAKFSEPSAVMASLVGKFSFDPLDLMDLKPSEFFDHVKQFVPGVDFKAMQAADDADFAARTDINRKAKGFRAQAGAIVVPPDAPTEKIDETPLLQRFEDAANTNADIEKQRAARAQQENQALRLIDGAAAARQTIGELEARIAELRQDVARLDGEAATIRSDLAALPLLPAPIDPSQVRKDLEAARARNAVFDLVTRRNDLIADAEIAEAQAKDLTDAMAAREKDKAEKIAAAKMPVPGLSFGKGGVLLNGQPFEQASDAEQLATCVALAAAANPALRVIRVRDGSRLDDDQWQRLSDLAEKMDMQIWLETVLSRRPNAIVIEDGHVQSMLQAAE